MDYGIDINGDGDTTNDWKIFYKGKDGEANEGRVFIIAADYVPTNDERLKAIIESKENKIAKGTSTNYSYYCINWYTSNLPNYGCYDGHSELNKKNEDGSEHEQCSFPDIFDSDMYYCSEHVGSDGKGGNINSRCVSELQCTGVWSAFANNYADYAIGGPTLEMWIASWNQKHGETNDSTSKLYCGAEGTGYKVGTNESSLSTSISGSSYYGSNDDGYGDTLYFPHKSDNLGNVDGDGYNEVCYGYWLASPSAGTSGAIMSVRSDGSISNNASLGARPLVCLKSNITCQYDQENNLFTLN